MFACCTVHYVFGDSEAVLQNTFIAVKLVRPYVLRLRTHADHLNYQH
jgi:hypothetical protein